MDWYDWGQGTKDGPVIQVAEYYGALSALKKMAQALGTVEDIPAMDEKLNSIKMNFDTVFWKENGYRSGKDLDERANAMAVCAGLADSSKWETITNILNAEGNCGPLFERWVQEALCLMGRSDYALLRMANRYRPQIDANFTTLWEYMERAFDERKGINSINYLTLNHGWNTPNTILSKFIAGVAPVNPGWTTFQVMPQEAFLNDLQVKVPSVQGEVAVSIKKTPANYRLSVTSPAKTMANVGIPKAAFSKLDEITINGKTAWKRGPRGTIEGVTFLGEDTKFVMFAVKPGTWSIEGTGAVKMESPKPPAVVSKPGLKLDKKAWTVSASVDNQTFEAGPWGKEKMTVDASSANLIDGDYWTGWRTKTDQVPGQWVVIDLKQRQSFNKVVMDNVWSIYDSPAGYAIYVSDNTADWGCPVASGAGELWGITTATFATKTGRYIKIEQTGTKKQIWSIHELDLWRM